LSVKAKMFENRPEMLLVKQNFNTIHFQETYAESFEINT